LINYGNHLLTVEGSDQKISVAKYIISELENDELQLSNNDYLLIYNEVIADIEKTGTFVQEHFINHQNPIISKITVDMLLAPYNLSRIWEKHEAFVATEDMRLKYIVPETVINFKNKYVEDELKRIGELLKITTDNNEIDELMKRYLKMKEIHKLISKRLGDRIIS
jgi:DNA primase